MYVCHVCSSVCTCLYVCVHTLACAFTCVHVIISLWTHWIKVTPFPPLLAEMTGWAGWALGRWCFGDTVTRCPPPRPPVYKRRADCSGSLRPGWSEQPFMSALDWAQFHSKNAGGGMFKMKQGQLKIPASWAIMWTQNVLGRLAAALGSRPSKKTRPAWMALLPSLHSPAAWGACWCGSLPGIAL